MELWMWIVAGVIAALALFAIVTLLRRSARRSGRRQRRHAELRDRFGPEYERAVDEEGRKAGRLMLEQRLSDYDGLEHPTLAPGERDQITEEWRRAQFGFVDSPERAVREAEHLVVSVMESRGYPTADASVRADALSVDDASLAAAYRVAHRAFLHADRGDAGVEQLLGAFLVYRELLEFLLARPQRERTTAEAEPPEIDDESSVHVAS
jgi:hypothetical protein